jgi:hypothetical protein
VLRRRVLALLSSVVLPAAGCAGSPGTGDGSETTATPTPTEQSTPTSASTTASTPPTGDVAVETPAAGECESSPPPSPAGNDLESPAPYPDLPAEPGDDGESFLAAYEAAYVHNALLADSNPPAGMVVAEVDLDARVVASRSGEGWLLAGVATGGAVGYGHTPTPTPGPNETSGPTATAVPGTTYHRRASYLLTDRFLLRQDRGHDGTPPAAVDGGVVLVCR